MKMLERPGFFGRKRDKIEAALDEKYGKGNWAIRWKWGDELLTFEEAIVHYEEGYYQAICRGNLLHHITAFKECYDNAITNILSGMDYSAQENSSNHYQDISVRRVLKRQTLAFEGVDTEHLEDVDLSTVLHIRQNSKQPLGKLLSPGNVWFHRFEMIEKPFVTGWWKPNTVECFWQSNKIIVLLEED